MATTSKDSATTFTTPSDREVVITRVVDAPRRLVFDAQTKPEHLPHWMLGPDGWTMPVCEVDLRPGGEWHFVWRRSDGTEMEMRGVYREITPPERLVHTESWGGDWAETLNTLVLTEEGGKTTMACTVLYPSKEARDAALQTRMKDGISQSFDRLDKYLRTGANSGPGYKKHPEHRIEAKAAGVRVQVAFNGEVIADSREAVRFEEGDYPVVYYVPRKDVQMGRLVRSTHQTYCPFKGHASYYSFVNGPINAVWTYEQPYDEMSVIKELLAFYPDKVDSIRVVKE